jgi:iron complex outermembrane recepter protein
MRSSRERTRKILQRPIQQRGSTGITNLEVGVNLRDKLSLAIGANNIFNRYPNQINAANVGVEAQNYDNAAVAKYAPFSPFGIDGGFYYARIGYKS